MAIFGAVAILNVWASWRVFADQLSSWPQRWAQLAFVWLVPVIGALVTLHLKREQPERGAGTYPEPHDHEDFGESGRIHRRNVNESDPSDSHEPPAPE